MAGREVKEYTNLSDPKDKKLGKGKDRIDDEDITFQRMVAKGIHCSLVKEVVVYNLTEGNMVKQNTTRMQEVAGERGGYLHGRGALDSDDLLYLKEQMEAEEDAERLLQRAEKRAFAAFKKAASLADSSPAGAPLPLRVEPKPKSGIRQQDLLKNIVEIKPKWHRVSSPSDGNQPTIISNVQAAVNKMSEPLEKEYPSSRPTKREAEVDPKNPVRSLLDLAYESSDDEED